MINSDTTCRYKYPAQYTLTHRYHASTAAHVTLPNIAGTSVPIERPLHGSQNELDFQ